jgi:hypothetical protein
VFLAGFLTGVYFADCAALLRSVARATEACPEYGRPDLSMRTTCASGFE